MTPRIPELPEDSVLIAEAEALALSLLERALADTSRKESRRSKRLAALLGDDAGRDLLLDLTDQVLRIKTARRAAHRLHDLTKHGVPKALGTFDRTGLRALGLAAPIVPAMADALVDWRIDRDTHGVILPAEDPGFSEYVRSRTADGFDLNINVLGESILGDDEALARCNAVIARIERPDVNYVSVKISALCANLDVLAEADSLARIEDRMRMLFRAALRSTPQTFINLDMEEYRDLELSVRSFMAVLDEDEFHQMPAGIVLQAYIPDSHSALERLCAWANERHAAGRRGIKIRLVKGANLAMEQVEAELHDWAQAPYLTKSEVDASYKRMLESALSLADPGAVKLGIASHNLFEVAWALTVAKHAGAMDRIEIEMLEGMAPPQSRAVRDEAGALLLYSPVVAKADRDASIAYLSRRLDENSSPENFLRSLFDITPGSPAWELEKQRFRTSVAARATVGTTSQRTQDRTRPVAPRDPEGPFVNAPDTDFTSAANRQWIAAALDSVEVTEPVEMDSLDEVEAMLSRAVAAQQEWSLTSWTHRREVLARVADVMERHRGETMALMAMTAGKTANEGDPEVSEAIDFASYAGELTKSHEQRMAEGLIWTPSRVVVVAGPWNFPYAIPASGLVHAIAAGSAAIMKPAPETRAIAAALVAHLHEAGVPKDLVQLACTPDNTIGRHLITHDDVDLVMLTGSYDTASMFMQWKPSIHLHAETSGKNALIITSAADMDQAIKDLVKSAFGHAGQKCSAASLAIVEAEVYDDPDFHVRLADATRSLKVGSALDPATKVGPLVAPPSGSLQRALTTLEAGETWLVEPRQLDEGRSWTPGVRVGVAPGSWFHMTECFGPVLGVMRAESLEHAIELQNAPVYGLTGGIHSLDPVEIETWLSKVAVGNAYINRHITGAIVQRQPFGGWKRSSVGTGGKPGGPNHLSLYGTWTDDRNRSVTEAAVSLGQAWMSHFRMDNDPTGLAAESNVLRYRPLASVIVRHNGDADTRRILGAVAARAGVPMVEVTTDEDLARAIEACPEPYFTRIRALAPSTDEVLDIARQAGIPVDRAPLTTDGRTELPHWLLEQSVSRTMHRYGRLLNRG